MSDNKSIMSKMLQMMSGVTETPAQPVINESVVPSKLQSTISKLEKQYADVKKGKVLKESVDVGSAYDEEDEDDFDEAEYEQRMRGFKLLGSGAANGFSRVSEISSKINPAEFFGEPTTFSGDGKVTQAWVIKFEDGTIASIYDYKGSKWSVGANQNIPGASSRAIRNIREVLQNGPNFNEQGLNEGKMDDLKDAKAEKDANTWWDDKKSDKKDAKTVVKGKAYGGSKQDDKEEELDEGYDFGDGSEEDDTSLASNSKTTPDDVDGDRLWGVISYWTKDGKLTPEEESLIADIGEREVGQVTSEEETNLRHIAWQLFDDGIITSEELDKGYYMNESDESFDAPEAPAEDAIARRKRLQALKDKREDDAAAGEWDSGSTVGAKRTVQGRAYGNGAEEELDEISEPTLKSYKEKSNRDLNNTLRRTDRIEDNYGRGEEMPPKVADKYKKEGDRVHKRASGIRRANDQLASKKAKGLSFAKEFARMNEETKFGDKVKNSAKLTKAKKVKTLKESYGDDLKTILDKHKSAVTMFTRGTDLGSNSKMESLYDDLYEYYLNNQLMPYGIAKARDGDPMQWVSNALDDELSSRDQVTEYTDTMTQAQIPSPSNAQPVTTELDEIAKLAGLPTKSATDDFPPAPEEKAPLVLEKDADDFPPAPEEKAPIVLEEGPTVEVAGKPVNVRSVEVDNVNDWDAPDYADAYASYAEFEDGTPLSDDELEALQDQYPDVIYNAITDSNSGRADWNDSITDESQDVFNEDVNASISATGEDDVVNLIRKLSGLATKDNEVPQSTPSAELAGVIVADEIEEERDPEYINSPREQTAGISAAIPSGDDLNRGKKQYRREVPGDNPTAVAEAALWNKYTGMLKGLLK